ncbi:DUF4292 domain-containing protein [Flavilitoribacter nigricans]|uniref:DUF4292 domain-containing protein n=1 Tax=Flavilitoribacter nigricans (strain ATCC 23147 / DSM 23189 / NBRC 102662 / NCIMB 1420 / SS-2) TaxID=1122177 RepID=A0A2D0N913_FLAN2|nr:DUF4292 domain-containing protein [Flavilitoribacter nigricans]PHN04273.1 hypothetical protein CRP01_22180 [Flavilitoribacter nigricans DSM 23189 = NBRC 102662]
MLIQLRPTALLIILLAFAACKSAKKPETTKVKDVTAGKLLDHMVKNQVKADWLEAKARISYDGEDQSVSASASIVMRKDSLVWMSVRKLGFEVARVQIDKDSVYVINRLSNEYTIQGLDYLASSYNLPANLKTIQAILLGNPVFLNSRDMTLNKEEANYHLISSSGQLENHFWLDMASLALVRTRYGDLRNRREVNLLLEDYQPLDAEQNFSYLRQIKVDSSELGEAAIEIDFSDVKINVPQEIRFSIPSRYTRVD